MIYKGFLEVFGTLRCFGFNYPLVAEVHIECNRFPLPPKHGVNKVQYLAFVIGLHPKLDVALHRLRMRYGPEEWNNRSLIKYNGTYGNRRSSYQCGPRQSTLSTRPRTALEAGCPAVNMARVRGLADRSRESLSHRNSLLYEYTNAPSGPTPTLMDSSLPRSAIRL